MHLDTGDFATTGKNTMVEACRVMFDNFMPEGAQGDVARTIGNLPAFLRDVRVYGIFRIILHFRTQF